MTAKLAHAGATMHHGKDCSLLSVPMHVSAVVYKYNWVTVQCMLQRCTVLCAHCTSVSAMGPAYKALLTNP